MNVLVRLRVSEKDEPYPGALPLTAANVVSRINDVLNDVTKHDETLAWRISQVTQVTPKTAAIIDQIKGKIMNLEQVANQPATCDADTLRLSYMAEGLQLALDVIDAKLHGK